MNARLAAGSLPGARQTVAIVGNGMATFRLCEKLVQAGVTHALRIVILGEEAHPAYDRVHLTELLDGGRSAEDLWFATPGWFAENGIELYLGDPVTAIDRDECVVSTASGRRVYYDRLILATGASAIVPPVPGADLPGVQVYRTLEDVITLRRRAASGRRAAVMGGGLLGLEAARALVALGLGVTVLERSDRLMRRQLDAPAARVLRSLLEVSGVTVRTSITVRGSLCMPGGASALALRLDTGELLAADLVVLAAGVRPRDELARACDLEVSPAGGVVVNDALQTSDPRIFAVGDCASHGGEVYGLVAPAYQMVDVLVDGLLGGRARYTHGDSSTKLKVAGAPVAILGDPSHRGTGTASFDFEGPRCQRRLVVSRNAIVAATAVGEWPELEEVRELIARGTPVSWRQIQRFLRTGQLWASRPAIPISEWPEDALVCLCLNVTRGALGEWQAAGCASADALGRATGAGTMCGGCRPLLVELQGAESTEAPRAARRLSGNGAAVAPPAAVNEPTVTPGSPRRISLPPFQSVEVPAEVRRRVSGQMAAVEVPLAPRSLTLSALTSVGLIALVALADFAPPLRALGDWLCALTSSPGHTATVASGVSAVALMLLSLGISLRKRWRWPERISLSTWRAVHGSVNLVAALTLVVHTRLHAGANLSRALLAVTALTMVSGAAAAGIVAAAHRLRPRAAAGIQRRFALAHVVASAPLLALLAVHVLGMLYFLGLP